MESADLIFGPMLAQVTLVVIVATALAYRRVRDMRVLGLPHVGREGFPKRTVNTNDNLRNQSELPVLFYVLCVFFGLVGETTAFVLFTAWMFVGLRYLHAFVQLTSNTVFPWRFGSFAGSFLAVIMMTVLALHQLANLT